MAYAQIYAYNEVTSQYDIPISMGDETSPIITSVSKLMAMTSRVKLKIVSLDSGVYQAKMSFLNDLDSRWRLAPDIDGTGPGTFAATLSITSFPSYFWVQASGSGSELIDTDSSVNLAASANQDYVVLPSVSGDDQAVDNTIVVGVSEYSEANLAAGACEIQLSAWPEGSSRTVRTVSMNVNGTNTGAAGTLYLICKTASGNNELTKTITVGSYSRMVTIDVLNGAAEAYSSIVLRSYSEAAPLAGNHGTVFNVIITSNPDPKQDVFDTLRKLLLIGDTDFETSRMAALPDLITEFDSEIIGYASTDYAADTSRKLLLGDQEASFDSMVRTVYSGKVEAETKRIVSRIEVLVGDTLRKTKRTGELSGDTMRRTVIYFDAPFDTARKTNGYFEQFLDTVRKLEEHPIKKNYYFIS